MNWSFLVGLVAGTSVGTAVWWWHHFKIRRKLELLRTEDDCFLFSPHHLDLKCLTKSVKPSCQTLACPPCNFKKYIALIKSARTHLDVCLCLITSEELSKALVDLSNRGIFVRIILDKEMSMQALNSKLVVFAKEHIPIKIINGSEMMHNKFAIIDQKMVVTGSMNWTRQGSLFNYENCVLIHSKKVVEKYLDYFQDIWHLIDK